MSGIWDYETASSRRYSRTSGQGWTRKAHFENVPADTIDALLPAESSVYPGESDDNSAARLHRADISIGLREGVRSVDLLYRPRTWMEWLIHNPNHGVLFYSSRMISRPMKYDPEKNILLGPDPTDPTGRTQWELTEGTGLEDDYLSSVEVVAVVNSVDTYYTQYVDEVGAWNSRTIHGFPKTGTAIWRLSYISCEPIANVGKLWTVRLVFDYNPGRWSTETVSRKMVLETRKMPVYDADGEVGGGNPIGWKNVTMLVPSPTEVFRRGGLTNHAMFIAVSELLKDSW